MKGTLNMDISNMNNIESRVQSYWTKRAHNFNIVRKNELNSSISERWREEIVHFLPEGKVLQILDVGTGTGYFAILLSQSGHQVTGIDLTDAMLKGSPVITLHSIRSIPRFSKWMPRSLRFDQSLTLSSHAT